MKKIIYLLSVSAIFAACNSQPATEVSSEQTVAVDTVGTVYLIDTATSIMKWEGAALSYGHYGTLGLNNGKLVIKDGNITAGSFTIDVKSIKVADLTDPQKNASLVGHLNDTDFFNTKLFPTGQFDITNVAVLTNDTAGNTHAISGNLTLKGKTNNITFPAKISVSDDGVTANGEVTINRLNWDIKYNSTTAFPSLKAKLKDKAIKDEFKVSMSLTARKG